MMKYWREHYAHTSGTGISASMVLSVLAHAIVIATAVGATADPRTEERTLPENSIARFLAPPDRAAGQRPRAEMIRWVAVAVPDIGVGKALVPVDAVQPVEQLTRLDLRDEIAVPELHGADSVFSVVQVDSVATRYEWSAAPAYPPSMLAQSAEGLVRAEFVVSQDGYVDTLTLKVVESTHPDFTRAVRDALPFMRFKPAKIGNATVSQLVSQDFFFRITAIADTQRVTRPEP